MTDRRSLYAAIGLMAGSFLLMLTLALWDRSGDGRGTVLVSECRLLHGDLDAGLTARLLRRNAPLALETEAYYLPEGEPRPLAERLAAWGFPANGEGTPYPVKGAVLLESDGPAVQALAISRTDSSKTARPLAIRDADHAFAALEERYPLVANRAMARGLLGVSEDKGQKRFAPKLAMTRLYPDPALRAALRDFPALDGHAACRSRYLAAIRFGRRGAPRIDTIRLADQTLSR